MAQRVITTLIDDLDGTEATETVRFGLENGTFEIDLNEANASEFRSLLERYKTAARRVGGRASRTSVANVDMKAVRRWAQDNGVPVNPRGRIKEDVVRQFQSANA
jgi:hypothetical protein